MTLNASDIVLPPVLNNRLPANEVENQLKLFADQNLLAQLLDSTSGYILILNEYRQILYANNALRELLQNNSAELMVGKRTGEALNCQHAFLTPGGCGTSEFCADCGALKAIISSLNGNEDMQEWRVTTKDSNEAFDFRVWTKPLKFRNKTFFIFNFLDISNEKRRIALERIFFHDILNTASSLKIYLSLFERLSPDEIEEYVPLVYDITDNLLEDLHSQRDLILAENAELNVNCKTCNSLEMLIAAKNFYNQRFLLEKKELVISQDCQSFDFVSDESLLLRVLRNMIKNAIESIEKGEKVTISCTCNKYRMYYTVNNPGYLPAEVQHQIFQRSFSTKGIGRGLGTYSIKLISERYLKGKVYFTTRENEGTTFTAEYPINYFRKTDTKID